MEVSKVKLAAKLLGQYDKVDEFLNRTTGCDGITVTFRAKARTKSCSFDATVAMHVQAAMRDLLGELRDDLRELGVEIDA